MDQLLIFNFFAFEKFRKNGKNENGIKYFLTYSLLYFCKKFAEIPKKIFVTFPLVL
jgi:hypothetical protein